MQKGDRIYYVLGKSASCQRPQTLYLAATVINIGPRGRLVIRPDSSRNHRIVKDTHCIAAAELPAGAWTG